MCRCLKPLCAPLRLLVVLALTLVFAGPLHAAAKLRIDEVKIGPDRAPASWVLEKAIYLSAGDVGRFEKRFAASIDGVLNQHFTVDGAERVQVNYVACSSEENAATVYSGLIGLVGVENVVVRKANVVMEIISDSTLLQREAVSLLALNPLQSRKLTAANTPDRWRLVKEFFLPEDSLAAFKQRFGADIDEIVNQFFLVDEVQARINYVLCPDEAAAQKVYEGIHRLIGEKNRVFRLDTLVCEAISVDSRIKQKAEALLQAEP